MPSDSGAAQVFDPNPLPIYPQRADDRQIEGIVSVTFIVDREGSANNIDIDREEPKDYGFAYAFKTAMAHWKFLPATENNRPKDGKFSITYLFTQPQQ